MEEYGILLNEEELGIIINALDYTKYENDHVSFGDYDKLQEKICRIVEGGGKNVYSCRVYC